MPGYSDLHRAAARGSTRLITMQLDTGIDINIATDPDKDTPLHLACAAGELVSVQLLLDRGADTERTNQKGRTALFVSIDYPKIAELLLRHGANHGAKDVHGITPLLMAATGNHGGAGQATMKMLLQHGANPDTADNSGFTPLFAVCHQDRRAYGRVDAMKMLIEHRVNVNAVGKNHKNTPLHDVCMLIGKTAVTELVPMARMLVNNGANLRATNAYGATPLHQLVTREKVCCAELLDVARLLVDGGADVNAARTNHNTALHATSFSDAHLDIVKLLVGHGADLDVRSVDGWTPLHIAASRQCCAIMSLILGAGARVDARDRPGGETPLHLAARFGKLLSVKVLLRFKANALLRAQYEDEAITMLPLDVAARRGHLAVVRELVQQVGLEGCGGPSGGADALVLAVAEGRLGIVALLLDAGVVDTGAGLRFAIEGGHSKSVRLLMERRAGDVKQYVAPERVRGGVRTVLLHCFHEQTRAPSSCRIMQTLLEAGAPTRIKVLVNFQDSPPILLTDLVQYADYLINRGTIESAAEEETMLGLKGLRRLLMQKEAVTATSWTWPAVEGGMGIEGIEGIEGIRGPKKETKPSTALATMMPLLRRRAARRGMVLRALSRRKSTET